MKSRQSRHSSRSLELGSIKKKWQTRLPIALIYPNKYKVAMSNLAVHNLYSRLNSFDEVVCERVFLPEKKGEPIRSIESNRVLSDFEVIFISVSFENDFPNVVEMLKKGGVEVDAKERNLSQFIIAGGPAVTINPRALSNIADAIFIGEVDDELDEIVRIILSHHIKTKLDPPVKPEDDMLGKLLRMDGIYIPSISKTIPKKHYVSDLDKYPVHTTIDAESAEFGDMFLIEMGRGCSYSCKYCTVPVIYKPFRARSLEVLWKIAQKGLKRGQRLGLVCPEVVTHPAFKELAKRIIKAGGEFSTSSIRVDHVSKLTAELLARGGMKSVSVGIEAGREELRSKLGKRISDEKIISGVKILTDAGLKRIKLYFMIGLPKETSEDIKSIIELSKKIQKTVKKGTKIEVVLSPFVPKPGTLFEDTDFASRKYISNAHDSIRTKLAKEGIKISGRTIKDSEKEYLFSRQIM